MLHPEVSFVDVANIDGRDRLIAYEPGRLNWFDPESATERELVAVTPTSTRLAAAKSPMSMLLGM